MAANTTPIFTNVPKVSWTSLTGVDGSADGTDADVKSLFTADSTDGSFIQKLLIIPVSTSGSTSTSAAAVRIYLNNGSSVGTADNNSLIYEVTLPVTTVNVANTVAVTTFEIPLNIQLPPSYAVYVGVTALAANTNIRVTAFGGDY